MRPLLTRRNAGAKGPRNAIFLKSVTLCLTLSQAEAVAYCRILSQDQGEEQACILLHSVAKCCTCLPVQNAARSGHCCSCLAAKLSLRIVNAQKCYVLFQLNGLPLPMQKIAEVDQEVSRCLCILYGTMGLVERDACSRTQCAQFVVRESFPQRPRNRQRIICHRPEVAA